MQQIDDDIDTDVSALGQVDNYINDRENSFYVNCPTLKVSVKALKNELLNYRDSVKILKDSTDKIIDALIKMDSLSLSLIDNAEKTEIKNDDDRYKIMQEQLEFAKNKENFEKKCAQILKEHAIKVSKF